MKTNIKNEDDLKMKMIPKMKTNVKIVEDLKNLDRTRPELTQAYLCVFFIGKI